VDVRPELRPRPGGFLDLSCAIAAASVHELATSGRRRR
jgi:hypothetical protein